MAVDGKSNDKYESDDDMFLDHTADNEEKKDVRNKLKRWFQKIPYVLLSKFQG